MLILTSRSAGLVAAVLLLGAAFAEDALAQVTQGDLDALRQSFESQIAATQDNLNHVWTMAAACLVFLMQGGFLFLEAGLVRSKNSINVAQKNIADFVIATCCFYLVGFGLMFGPSAGGWFGTGTWAFDQLADWDFTFFVFQLVFCGTAATILSGAVAERMKFSGYLLATIVIAALVYPVYGHWAWGNLWIGDNTAWLADMGFIDFAGSTVVHSVGGWIALAAVLVIGPRIGRFDERGEPIPIHGHSAVLATMGAILLWVGWIGFNGGSTTTGSGDFAHIVSNTMLAGGFGGTIAMIIGRWQDGLFRPVWPINGVLAGLVGITAGCDAVSSHGAVLIGLSSGVIVFFATQFLERKLKIDDAVGAVPVHGICGAWGTIMAGALAMPDKLAAADRLSQVMIQGLGVAVAFVWAFGTAWLFFKLIDVVVGLRVSPEHELEGLNAAEHGTTLGTGQLQRALQELALGDGDIGRRLDATTGDEAGELALSFNLLMERLQKLVLGVADNAGRLVHASAELSTVSTALAESSTAAKSKAESVSKSTSSVSRSVDSMTASVGGVSDNVKSISDDASAVSGQIDGVSQEIGEMAQAMNAIMSSARRATAEAERTKACVSSAASTLNALGQASQRIGEVLDAIRRIAGQTRMLALNATIEAERAGAAGKGFAVVAGEVKRLADDTARATEDIEARIADIREGSDGAVSVIDEISTVIEGMNSTVDVVGRQLDEQIGRAGAIAERMSQARERSGSIADQISSVAGNAVAASAEARAAAEGTQQVFDGIGQVNHAAVQTSESATTVRRASDEVGRIARELEQAVGEIGRGAAAKG